MPTPDRERKIATVEAFVPLVPWVPLERSPQTHAATVPAEGQKPRLDPKPKIVSHEHRPRSRNAVDEQREPTGLRQTIQT